MSAKADHTARMSQAELFSNFQPTSCFAWACKRRVMGAPFPGLYSDLYHPWARELHDCQASYMTAKKSAQCGFTEIAINRALYTIDVLKRDVLYVLPTKTPDAADFSSARFGQALELSDYLRGLFTATNKIELKQAGGVSLYIRGSNSESGLRSIPVSELILDEYDIMREKSVLLALERLSGQTHKHVFALSTPKIPGKGIDAFYQESTQEHFFFKCPSCSRRIELKWPESIVLCGETINDPACLDSHYICYECEAQLDNENKRFYLAGGLWLPTCDNSDDHRGFEINQMYSSTVTPGEVAIAYQRGLNSEAAMTEFMNSKMGLAYVAADAQLRDENLDKALRAHLMTDNRPASADRMIVMGVDQGKWHYVSITEFFYPQLGYDLNAIAEAKVLWVGKVAEGDFGFFDRLMREWQVQHCVIDPDPNINDARRFARRFAGHVTLCRYRRGVAGKEIQISEEDSGSPIATVDRTNWIDAALGRFYTGRIELPRDIPLEYREQLKAPVRRYEDDPDGNPIAKYVETGPDHYAHAQVYCEIALPLAAAHTTNRSITTFL